MQNWIEDNNQLKRNFEFKDFVEAWDFMSQVASLAEEMGHHPTWTNTYNKVEIQLSTHDAGDKVTNKDRELAKKINQLLEK